MAAAKEERLRFRQLRQRNARDGVGCHGLVRGAVRNRVLTPHTDDAEKLRG